MGGTRDCGFVTLVASEAKGGEFSHLTLLTPDFSVYSFLTPY